MKNKFLLLYVLLLMSCRENGNKNEGTGAISSGAVNEKSFVRLGGEQQYVEITGSSTGNPVLLFLHGGPGWPQTPHLRYFNNELTNTVTLVAWEQAGAGKSYMKNANPDTLSLEQMIEDGHELTQILKKKFKKEKIYLAGFSWGSLIGLKLVEKYPEDYAAYIGISQLINVNQTVKASREWVRKQADSKNDTAALALLNRIEKGDTSLCKRPLDCFIKQHEILSRYGGAIFSKESEAAIQKAEQSYEDYKEYDWLKAFLHSANRLEKDLFSADLTAIKKLKLPVYFFQGRYDWNLPSIVVEEYFKALTAPKKELVWFENSGHELSSEEASLFNQMVAERVVKK